MQFTILGVFLAAASFSPIIGAKGRPVMKNRIFNTHVFGWTACGLLLASLQNPQPAGSGSLEPYITDPSYEVLRLPQGSGPLVFATMETRVFLGIWSEEREEEHVQGAPTTEKKVPKVDPKDYVPDIVENVIHWSVRRNPQIAGKGHGDWPEESIDVEVPYRLRDVLRLANGEALTLGVSKKGATVFESWVFDRPNRPVANKDLWLPVDKFSSGMFLTKSYDVDFSKPDPGPSPKVRRKIVKEKIYPGEPVAASAFLPTGTIFLLTRNPKTKATTLRKIETRKGWAETVIKTSAQLPSLAAAIKVRVYPVGESIGYLLSVSGEGFARIVDGEQEIKWVRETLCLEDLNGDGVFEAEQVFEDWRGLYKYQRALK